MTEDAGEREIVLVPDETQFRCDMEQGTASVSTYGCKFELNYDFRHYYRRVFKVFVKSNGTIKVFATARNGDLNPAANYTIPPTERNRILSQNFNCRLNPSGILQIFTSPSPVSSFEGEYGSLMGTLGPGRKSSDSSAAASTSTLTAGGNDEYGSSAPESRKTSKARSSIDSTGSEFIRDDDDDDRSRDEYELDDGERTKGSKLNLPKLTNPTRAKKVIITPTIDRNSMRSTTVVSTPWGQRVAATQKVTSGKFKETVGVEGYLPKEISIDISNMCIFINGKKQSEQEPSFTRKIEIPTHITPETIVCSFDTSTEIITIGVKK